MSALGGQRITYLLAGAVTAAVYYALLYLALLVTEGRVSYLFLAFASHMITVAIVYPWFRIVVFRVSGEPWLPGYLRFYTVGLSFLVASFVGLPLLVELAGIPIMIAQLLIIAVNPPLTYVIHRKWTFRRRANI
ncbi:GtrA family protein [Streptosporangium sp. NPDC051023]|uniref:GtrA family protein n=1 Tax=Streptosporangium sp. NPDC051023 TaxID=3155410 RepID=UPI00344F0B0D